MKSYLALIRRADFIDFFKFGFFYLNSDKVVEFDCPISELPKRDDIYDALFARINSFESSFAYLIINFTKANDADDSSVTKKTNILLIPYEGFSSSKVTKAQSIPGIKIIPINDFLANMENYVEV